MTSKSVYHKDIKGKIHMEIPETPDLDKPFAVFLHGGSPKSQHTGFWSPIHEISSKYCNPVYMDRYGHGKSVNEGKVGIRDHLRTINGVIDQVLQKYNQENVIIIGRSAGGGYAMRTLNEMPEKISGLGLIAPGSLKSNAKYLKGWTKPTVVLWDKEDPVVRFDYYPLLLEVVPHAKLFLIGEGHAEISIDRGEIKKTHAPELGAPNLYESFLETLVNKIL